MKTKRAQHFAAIAVALLFGSCHRDRDRTLEEMINRSYPVDAATTLSITNRDGSIRVYGAGAEVHDVHVEAIKKAYSPARLKSISVNIVAQRDSITITTTYPDDPRFGLSDRSGTVDYVIVVPQSMRIAKLDLANGEVLVEGMRSDQARVVLGNGRLFAHNCFGNLELALQTGNLAIVYEWWEDQEFAIRATIQDGNAFAYIPSDAAFHIIAHTTTGKIGNDFTEKEDRHPEPIDKIDMLVNGGGKTTFQFESHDGNIKISEHNP